MVGKRVQDHRCVLPRLDDLIQVADRAFPHGPCQRAVYPFRLAATQQEPADEIRRGQVVVAGHGDQRPLEVVCHGLNEARLATACGALEQDRQSLPESGLEHLLLVAHRHVVRPQLLVRHHFPSVAAHFALIFVVGGPPPTAAPTGTVVRSSRSVGRVVGRSHGRRCRTPARNSSASVLAPMVRHRQPVPALARLGKRTAGVGRTVNTFIAVVEGQSVGQHHKQPPRRPAVALQHRRTVPDRRAQPSSTHRERAREGGASPACRRRRRSASPVSTSPPTDPGNEKRRAPPDLRGRAARW